MPIRTFVDACVLIAASRGDAATSEEAFAVLEDPEREFVTNDFLWLETVPKPRYNGFARQADFIETYFEAAVDNGVASPAAVNAAKELALRYGLSGLDALHIQTSLEFGAAEFVTGEIKEVLTRVREIKVIQLGGRPKP